MAGMCNICRQPASQRCSRCHLAYYCSREHQQLDWRNHRGCCCPFKVAHSKTLGRYFLAVRNLEPGTVVLREEPLVTGPPLTSDLLCVACYQPLPHTDNWGTRCDRCGWPVCSQSCADSPVHRPECDLTCQNIKHKVDIEPLLSSHPIYRCLIILRCLLLRKSHPEVWKKLQCMESHCVKRKAMGQYEQDRLKVAKFLLPFFHLQEEFTEEDVVRLCGIIQVNNYLVRLLEPFHLAVYDMASFIEHNCVPNCAKVFTASGGLILKVATPVKRGQHLSICYTNACFGTVPRRAQLKEELLVCRCQRCSDPTELGSYYSALRCQVSGCAGYVLLEKDIAEDSNNNEKCGSSWHCDSCHTMVPADTVFCILRRVINAQATLDRKVPDACKCFLADYGSLLHSNHYLLLDVHLSLAKRPVEKATDEELAKKWTLVQQMLKMTDLILPAENRLRGLLLFELSSTIMETQLRKAQNGGTFPIEFCSQISEAKQLLNMSVKVLSDQPDIIPESTVAKLAAEKLLAIDTYLKTSSQVIQVD